MTTLFISDVHLSAERPEMVAAALAFLGREARAARALYILGDFFDQWLGDDDDAPPHPEVLEALAALTASGVPVGVVPGNHDFLLGDDFARRTGCRLLGDSTVIDLHGTPVLLMHGDTLCTDDRDYQEFRRYARDPANQRRFLALPLAERAARAAELRVESQRRSRLKPEDIMDVNPEAVAQAMREHGVRHLVHGHTHRPAVHRLHVDGASALRVVLGDWYEQDSVLAWDSRGPRLGRLRTGGGGAAAPGGGGG